jgi:hypothetical protein
MKGWGDTYTTCSATKMSAQITIPAEPNTIGLSPHLTLRTERHPIIEIAHLFLNGR